MKKVSDKIPNKEIDTSNFYRYPIIDQTPVVEENITDWDDVIFDEQQEETKLNKERERLQKQILESEMNIENLRRHFNERPNNNSTIDVLLKLAESVGPIIGNMIVNNNNSDGKLRLTGVYKGDKIDVELQNNKFMIMMVMTMLGEILQQIELVEKSEKVPASEKMKELKELKERINYEFMKKQYMDELKRLG